MPRMALDGFSLEFPDGWHSRLLAVIGPEEKFGRSEAKYQANVIVAVERLEKPTDVNTFLEEQLKSLKKDLKNFREIRRELLTLGGEAAPAIEYSFLSPDGIMLRQINCYRPLPGNRMLVLNASHLIGKRFDDARETFVQIYSSLKIG